jgi:LysR family glycine cleavage system transcriptional activator
MQKNVKPLRSLSGLIDFDCAARWGSFTLAAQELHKTPAAISLQVKQLESAVGFALFIRHPRRVTLTEKGQELALTVARMLTELRAKVDALQGSDDANVLRISTTHSFALKWLVPRLSRFTELYPELDIRIDSNDRLVDLADDGVDVAIRHQPYQAGEPSLLMAERLVIVYSPSLLAPGQQALTVDDLTRFPLLYENTTDTWIRMLKTNNAIRGQYDFSRSYNNFGVLVQAALAGQGIALVAYGIAYDDIRKGALLMLPCLSVPLEKGYCFLANPAKQGMQKVARLRAWLVTEMAEMQRSLAC